jgi:hypothetical protein
MWYVLGTEEVHTGFCCGDLLGRDHWEHLKWNFKEWVEEVCAGLIRLRIRTGGGRL